MQIDPVTAAAAEPRRPKVGADGEAFSYAMANASLEAQAGVSLKAHGAKPAEASAPAARQGPPQPESAARNTSEGPNEAAQTSRRAEDSRPGPVAAATQGQAPKAAALPAAQPALAPHLAQHAAIAAQGAAAQTPRPVSGGAAIADASMPAPRAAAKAQAPVAPKETAKPQETFATLLARRIEGEKSAFDIRLDPPDLGRIAGRFEIGDDGKATLRLSFDNQSTFDMFRRDEAALRLALEEAGVDVSGQAFEFDYRPAAETAPAFASASFAAAPENFAYLSQWSTGAVDLTI